MVAVTTTTTTSPTLSPKHRIWLSTNNHQLNNNFLRLLSENPIPRRSLSLYCSRPAKHSIKVSAVTPVIETSKSSSDNVPTIIDVDIGDRSYPIYIGSGLLNQPALLQRHILGKSVLVVTNTTVAPLYLDKVVAALTSGNPNLTVETLILPDGEKYKNMDTVVKICDKAIMSQLDRRCTFVALGGGVISDTCGYAASSLVRGVNFIQIPTTIMAQVDSSVEGKTGVNHRLRKNGIRGIYQPQCVLIDTDTLNTLPDKELASGLVEVNKHGLISDAPFLEWQEKNMQALMSRNPNALAYAIRRFCENKAAYSRLSPKHKIRLSTNNHHLDKSSSDNVPTIVHVDLGDRSYPIYIGSGLLNQPALLQRHIHGKSVLVVTNTTVAPLYLDKVVTSLTFENPEVTVESVILPDGEKFKNVDTLMKVLDKGFESGMDEDCTFVALGGGVIGDICGYAAASFLDGANFIQIPTTVMAQVDSSVGGKTGINQLGKNMIGRFYQPKCVVIDTDTLNTLPDRELASGHAEVIKYGLIRDASFFEWLEKNMQALMSRDTDAFSYAIKRSCENKAEVVSQDEKETGLRATLNLGHTFGHAIETSYGYGQWLHGEAVAAGMVMAVDLSYRIGWIDKSIVERVNDILKQAKQPTTPPEMMTVDMFKSVMAVDKKVADGILRLILLKGPLGNCVLTGEYDLKALDKTLHAFCKS